MKQLILILSVTSLLLFGAWGCSEKPEQSAGPAEIKGADTVETAQTDMVKATEDAKEKAKKIIEEMQVKTQDSTGETEGSQ